MDEGQLALLQYGLWYKNVYGLDPKNRPDDSVIEDDDLLDTWWKNFVREQTMKAGGRDPGDARYRIVDFVPGGGGDPSLSQANS